MAWNHPTPKVEIKEHKRLVPFKSPYAKVACVLLALAVVSIFVYILIPSSSDGVPTKASHKGSLTQGGKDQQNAKTRTDDAIATKSTTNVSSKVGEATTNGHKAVAVKGVCVTNAVHNKESVVILKDGSVYVPKKPIFHKPVERLFSKAVQPVHAPGSFPGAVIFANRFTDEQLIALMKEKVEIKPTDTERMVQAKLDVQELKDRVLEHVKDGGSVRDVFEEIDQQALDEHRERHFTDVGLRMARKIGDPEVTRAWIQKRNVRLKELGMPEIPVPPETPPATGGTANE